MLPLPGHTKSTHQAKSVQGSGHSMGGWEQLALGRSSVFEQLQSHSPPPRPPMSTVPSGGSRLAQQGMLLSELLCQGCWEQPCLPCEQAT